MKKELTFFLVALTLIAFSNRLASQTPTCSNAALTAKYWQYRKTFNEHFIKIDRRQDGCIGNGLAATDSASQNVTCNTQLLHGYSLPATSINLTDNGKWGLDDRGYSTDPDDPPETLTPFTDFTCSELNGDTSYISWDNSIHNYIEYSVETPHQLGWYLVVLATEYELLKRNEKYDQAQKTLEEIFLALQAYRRLDITANCLVKQRYNEITEGFEIENCPIEVGFNQITGPCLCPQKYDIGPCKDRAEHLDIPCKANCDWQLI